MSQTTTETISPLRLTSSIKCTTDNHGNQSHSNGGDEAMVTFSDLLRDDLQVSLYDFELKYKNEFVLFRLRNVGFFKLLKGR